MTDGSVRHVLRQITSNSTCPRGYRRRRRAELVLPIYLAGIYYCIVGKRGKEKRMGIWTDGKLSPTWDGGWGLEWGGLVGRFSKCFVLVVVVLESGFVLFCFVSHIRRKGAGLGTREVLMVPLFLGCLFLFLLLPFGPAMFHQFLLRFPPLLLPLFVCLLFWCADLHFDLIESGCSFCWIDTTCYVTPLHFYDRYITL